MSALNVIGIIFYWVLLLFLKTISHIFYLLLSLVFSCSLLFFIVCFFIRHTTRIFFIIYYFFYFLFILFTRGPWTVYHFLKVACLSTSISFFALLLFIIHWKKEKYKRNNIFYLAIPVPDNIWTYFTINSLDYDEFIVWLPILFLLMVIFYCDYQCRYLRSIRIDKAFLERQSDTTSIGYHTRLNLYNWLDRKIRNVLYVLTIELLYTILVIRNKKWPTKK